MALVLFGIRLSSNLEWSSWTHCCLSVVFTQQHHLVDRTGLNKTPPKQSTVLRHSWLQRSLQYLLLLFFYCYCSFSDCRSKKKNNYTVHMKIHNKVPHSRDSFEELTKCQWTVTDCSPKISSAKNFQTFIWGTVSLSSTFSPLSTSHYSDHTGSRSANQLTFSSPTAISPSIYKPAAHSLTARLSSVACMTL